MRKNVLALGVAAMIGGLAFSNAAMAMGSIGGVSATEANPGGRIVGTTAAPDFVNTEATATALVVNGDHIGHKLVVPYFSVQNGNDTYLNIVNTDTVRGKAVKVRFRGAANSDDVFDFQVFLSPGDMWAAALTTNANGNAILRTSDNSCTLPQTLSEREFILTRVDGSLDAAGRAAQVKEGYVEIINMADIAAEKADAAVPAALGVYPNEIDADDATSLNDLYSAIKHVNGVAPCFSTVATARALNNLAVDPENEEAARELGLDNPTTGLSASWVVLNVASVNTFSGVATAVEARDVPAVAAVPGVDAGNIVFYPQTNVAMGQAQGDGSTADALYISAAEDAAGDPVVGPIVQPLRWDAPDLSTPYLAGNTPSAQAEDVAAALAVVSVTNEYVISPTIAAHTDWVFSMPTRRYAVAVDYGSAATDPAWVARAIYNPNVNDHFDQTNAVLPAGGRAVCVRNVNVDAGYWDREERQPQVVVADPVFDVSPGIPDAAPEEIPLCGEAAVITFASAGAGGVSPLNASIAQQTITLDAGYQTGWVPVTTTGLGNGLPVTGYAAMRASNGASNYGMTWAHRVVR